MNRRIIASVVGALTLLVIAGMVAAGESEEQGPASISGYGPVSEDAIRQWLQAEQYGDVQVTRLASAFVATGIKDGKTEGFVIDSQSGRLLTDEPDD